MAYKSQATCHHTETADALPTAQACDAAQKLDAPLQATLRR